MKVLLWIILAITWLISVASTVYLGIKEKIENNLPYTVGNAIVDVFFGSFGVGLVEIILWIGNKILIGIGFIFFYIAKLVSPFLNKRIL